MAGTVSNYVAGDPNLAEMASKSYSRIRLLNKEAKDVWLEATPANNQKMSACSSRSAFRCIRTWMCRVGIMVGASGRYAIGLLVERKMYRRDAACAEAVKKFAPTYPFEELQKIPDREGKACKGIS